MRQLFFIFCFLLACNLSCAKPYYKPPQIDPAKLSATYNKFNEKRKELFRAEVQRFMDSIKRLDDLSFPLTRTAIHFTKSRDQIRRRMGFKYATSSMWDWKKLEPYKHSVLFEEYNLEKHSSSASVWHVTKGSPAETAGLQVGDKIVAINGKPFSSHKGFDDIFQKMLKRSRKLVPLEGGRRGLLKESWSPIDLTIRRKTSDGIKEFTLSVETVSVCAFGVNYINDKALNAYADGNYVYITAGMMEFVQNDQELQFVIVHELAHNLEKHLQKRKQNALMGEFLGGILDGILAAYTGSYSTVGQEGLGTAGAILYSKDFEREADYLGMYILANTQIDLDGIYQFWERMNNTRKEPGTFNFTHPSDAERTVSLQITAEEIKYKRSFSEWVVPNQ